MGSGFTTVNLNATNTNISTWTGGSETNVRGNGNSILAFSEAGDTKDSITVTGMNNSVATGDADTEVTIKA